MMDLIRPLPEVDAPHGHRKGLDVTGPLFVLYNILMKMKSAFLKTETFRSKDFWLSAALVASGCGIIRLEWEGPTAYFVFSDGLRCETLADNYWQGTLKVSAKGMADASRTLKDRLHFRDDKNT